MRYTCERTRKRARQDNIRTLSVSRKVRMILTICRARIMLWIIVFRQDWIKISATGLNTTRMWRSLLKVLSVGATGDLDVYLIAPTYHHFRWWASMTTSKAIWQCTHSTMLAKRDGTSWCCKQGPDSSKNVTSCNSSFYVHRWTHYCRLSYFWYVKSS